MIQQSYINLYDCLRRYVWDFNVVKLIADIEILSFTTFPDIAKLASCLSELRTAISDVFSDDQELCSAFEKFAEIISDDNEPYISISKVREVLDDEDR